MNRTLSKLALGISLALLALPSDVLAGRGGGGRGGYGGGWPRWRWRLLAAVAAAAAAARWAEDRWATLPHSASPTRSRASRVPTATARNTATRARRTTTRVPPPPAQATPTATRARRTRTRVPPPAQGYANRNQGSQYPNAGGGCCRRRATPTAISSQYPNAGAAAAGAGYANRNQARSIPTRVPPPPVQAMPITITAPGTATIMQAGGRRDWARVTRAGSGPGASARRCTAGAIRAIAIPTMAAVTGRAAFRRPGPCSSRQFAAVDRGAGLRLLPADQHDRRGARAGRRRPGDFGVRPGPRGVQVGRLCPGRSARPAGTRPDAQ